MKKINKDIYKEASYGKKHLMTFAIIVFLISLCAIGGGIAMIVVGAKALSLTKIILLCIFGAILTLLGLGFGGFSIIMFFTSTAMLKNEEESVKDGNRAIGTINIVKCDKCGEELPDNATFCSKCGTAVDGVKQCKCGVTNKSDADYCVACGDKL